MGRDEGKGWAKQVAENGDGEGSGRTQKGAKQLRTRVAVLPLIADCPLMFTLDNSLAMTPPPSTA